MKVSSIIKVTAVTTALALSTGAHAQFGGLGALSKVVGGGGGGGGGEAAPTADAGAVVKNARNALTSFVKAKLGLIEAMGGSEELAAQKKMLEGLKQGDATASKADLETIVSLDKATDEMINKKIADNTKLEAKNKTIAAASMVEYVSGLVSAKKTVSTISSLSDNPMSLGSNLGSVVFLAKELPGIASSGASTTSTLFTYLKSNGVDTSKAKKAAEGLGV